MTKFIIEKTERTPLVIIDTENGAFKMQYDSRPEDVRRFYKPILDKLKEALEEIKKGDNISFFDNKPFDFTFKLGYFNSSSAKFILDILNIIKQFKDSNINLQVNWHYYEDEEDMMEAGEDFSDFCEIEFNYISMVDDD